MSWWAALSQVASVICWNLLVPVVWFAHVLAGAKLEFAEGHMLMNDQAVRAIGMYAFGSAHSWLLASWAISTSLISLLLRPTRFAFLKRSIVYWLLAAPLVWYLNAMMCLTGKLIV
jgi:hypothetical protein